MIRSLFALLLALVLAATSVSAAVTHGQMQGAQQMVICSDIDTSTGLKTITLDATGKPIANPHHCQDCTAGFAALLPRLFDLATRHAVQMPLHVRQVPDRVSRATPPQSARDPPTFA